MDFNCDGYHDVLVFRSSDGRFWKWYGGPGQSPDFAGDQQGHAIGTPGAVTGAQMVPFNYLYLDLPSC